MGKVFAVSDLHGQYDYFKQIKEYMKEDDMCYVLGDCVDRGPGSIKILLDIIADKRFKMIKGNHEQIMIEALEQAEQGYMDFQLWYMNGGYETHLEFMSYSREIQLAVISYLKRLPVKLEYKDIILTHAGFSFALEEYVLDDILDEERLMWDRSHLTSTAKSKRGKIQVHGHTPTGLIKEGVEGVFMYSEGKYCIDTGCCFGYPAALLDLDDLLVEYFFKEER